MVMILGIELDRGQKSYNLNKMVNMSLLLLLIVAALSETVPLDKTVLNKIYQQNQIYVIYVHDSTHNFQVEAVFNAHCFGEKLCAILDPHNSDYYQLLDFIGYKEEEYFLIIDGVNKRKFIKSIVNGSITTNDLLSFEYQFLFKELQPFFASEVFSGQYNVRCTKLVGKNVGEFFRRSERAKVIFLYNLNDQCSTCDEILKEFILFAEHHYEESRVAFGYFNTFLNDHPIIQDEKTPSFLIFVDDQYQTPYELSASNMEGLSYFLSKMLGKQFQARPKPDQTVRIEKQDLQLL